MLFPSALPRRRPLPLFILCAALLGAAVPLSAQSEPAPIADSKVADPAWLYAGSDIARDAAWQFGTLPNGVRYAVRNNGVPPGQVSIRVRIDAGSMFETEQERGFAHLLEHLSFRGSVHVPDGEAKRIWQRFGVTFGSDSNAQTTPTQTVYQLDLPSVTPVNLDEGMRILAGMVRDPRISVAAVDAERGVVLSELRESSGPAQRVGEAINAHLFQGQLLGDRSPIGTAASLEASRADSVAAFHKRWYRPDRTVVVISGDGRPQDFSALVAKYYGDWEAGAPNPAQPDFGKPDPKGVAVREIVEPNQPLSITLAQIRPWKSQIDTVENTRRLYLEFLALALVNRRLENRARTGGSYLVATVEQEYVSRSADVTLTQIVPLTDWRAALTDVRGVIADAVRLAPSQADIDRESNEIAAFLQKELLNAQNEPGSRLADDLVRAVDIGETVTTPQGQVDMFAAIRSSATPKVMLDISRQIFSGSVTRVALTTPKPIAGGAAALQAALTQPIMARNGDRLAEKPVSMDELPKLGPAGTIGATAILPGLLAERIEFANGVTALISNNSIEPDKVRVNVRFGNGYRSVAGNAPNLLWTGDYALVASGIGPWGQNQIDQLTNGRQIQLDFAIDDDAFELAAESSPADIGDQLRLIAAKLTSPRWDSAPVDRLRIGFLTGYDLQDATPNAVLDRDLQSWVHDGDKRWTAPDRAEIEALTPAAFRAFWEPLLASGPIEVQLFGDLRALDYRKLLAETFGALARRPVIAPAAGQTIAFPAPVSEPQLRFHTGDQGQAAAMVAWPTGGGVAGVRDSRGLDVLAAIFNDRLFDRLRAEDGASYGPVVNSDWPVAFDKGGYLLVGSLLAPRDVDRFYRIADEIARDLVAKPIAADELARNAGPIREQVSRASTGNVFWMFLLEGATRDAQRARVAMAYEADVASITTADIQRLAARYLLPATQWSLVVLPKGQTLADARAAGVAGGR